MLDQTADFRLPVECHLKLVMNVPGGWVEYYPPYRVSVHDQCVLNELSTHTQMALTGAVKQFAIALLVRYGRWI
jgi:hypothetical protein